jgi:hypothetical protein
MAESIYTIGGRKYAFDEPLTPEELRELQEKFGGAPTAAKPAPAPAPAATPVAKETVAEKPQEDAGILEYLLNAAKRGVTGTTSMLGTAYETGTEMNRKLQEMADRASREKMTVQQRMDMLRQSGYFPNLTDLAEKYGQQQRTAARVTGARDLRAPGPVTEILGAGVEAAADPLGLIGKAKILPVAKRAVGEFVTGTAADIGGRGGAAVEEAITGEESGLGRLAGSVLAGGASTLKRETGSRVFNELLDKYRQVKLTGSSDEAAEEYAKGAAKRLLEFAAKEQGADSLQEIIKEAGEAAKFSTGENAPLLVALADNPVIRQQVIRLAKTDPAFRQQVNDTLASLGDDMRGKVEKIFGVRYEATGKGRSIFEPGYVPGKEQPKGLDIGNVAERREVLSQRIEDVASGFEPTKSKEEIGSRIESLIEDKKKLARQEVSPEYEALLSEARGARVEMPPDGVGTIYDFVRENNLRDIFGKNTDLDKRIMSVLAPKEFPVPGTAETVLEHLPMSFDNVESLKKAINELKRQRMSEDSLRKVMQLEEIVDEARKSIPGDFSDRLDAIDLKYYEKVGVPFGAQGVKDVDSKKYATQVAPIIVKNSESFDQFIRAVGKEDGYKIAEDSIISEIYDRAVKDGELNPGALAKYLKQKEGIIRQIPGLEDKLRGALSDDSVLRARINQLDDAAASAQKRIADNALTKFEAPNYTTLARSFMTDPKSREKLLRDIGDLDADSAKAVRRTLRAEVIALADENPTGFMDYLMNPANKDALDKIFGSAFQPALRKVGLLSDKLAQADISKVGVAVTKEDLDPLAKLAPGLDIPYISSTFRDRITSLPQKVVRLMSRVNSARLLQKTDETIKELLLDPNGVQKLANVASEIDFSVDVAGRLKKLSNTLSDVMPRALYTSGKTAVAGEEREQRGRERQEQLAEDIITGGFEDESGMPTEGGTPMTPSKEAPEDDGAAQDYSYENLGPDQIAKVGRYLDQYGLNKDFLLNAQTFNATPVEKRKKLFDLLASNRMADGGLVEPGNIDVSKLPAVKNADGTYSTVKSMGVNINGKEVLIPTVINGRVVSDKEAINHYLKTGKHLGVFSTPEESSAYAEKLHQMEAQRIKKARGGYTLAEELLLRRYANR